MPLVNRYRKPLTQGDCRALVNALQGSLENRFRQTSINQVKEIYREAIDMLPDLINHCISETRNSYTVSEFFSIFNRAVVWDIATFFNNSKRNPDNLTRNLDRVQYDLEETAGEPKLMKFFGKSAQLSDTDESYERTVHQLQWSPTPFPGVEALGNYQISRTDVQRLYAGSHNNLVQMIDYYEKKKLIDPANAWRYQMEINKNRMYLHTQLRLVDYAWKDAAHLQRKLRLGKAVTFGDLYAFLSDFNAIGRPNDPGAGKLCGARVRIKGYATGDNFAVVGMAPPVAPKAMINTLDIIAHFMNEIWPYRDTAIGKTWAIQLAAFAESMVASMQAFEDGNKRSARMLRDVILMSFGLPPCMPECSSIIPSAIGAVHADFDQRAADALKSVLECNDALIAMKGLTPLFDVHLPQVGILNGLGVRQQVPFGYIAQHLPCCYAVQQVQVNPFVRQVFAAQLFSPCVAHR